eukprot:921600-Pelagomonas_calceolata.AAC.1
MKKILQADMRLSSRSDDRWSSHILSAMDGLANSHILKQKLLNCEPIDQSFCCRSKDQASTILGAFFQYTP